MAKFVELNEAARILGVTPDELVEMRAEGEIHGYRDGASWKFKSDEVDRVLGERGGPGAAGDEGMPPDEEPDASVLVSEEALGHSGESTSSTIIGQGGESEAADSDLSLSADDSGLSLGSSSDLSVASGAETDSALDGGSGIDSDVTLVPGAGGGSDVSLVPDPGSDKEMTPGGGSSDREGLELGEDSDLGAGDIDLALDGDLALSDDDDIVLSGGSGSGSGSDLSLNSADSGIDLSSPSDSGLSLEADSGISLQSPTDSGLSLEGEAVDMGSGSSISSLELPEDEDISLDEAASGEAGVQQDEQFMLSPSDEMFADESDSGSQVIALEDSEAFDQEGGDAALLAETGGVDELGGAGPAAPAMAPARGYAAEIAEAPYSVWNIMGLVLAMLFLMLTGILMTDIVRNMWGWEEGRDVSTSISEGITRAFGL